MKDKLLKEKEILPEQLMMNDSRSVRISANKITKKKKKTSPKSPQKKEKRICKNKRWLKDGLRKSSPKEALKTQTNHIKKRIRSEEQMKLRLKHKALQKKEHYKDN